MILPSLNPVNCWNTVKLLLYSVAGNGGRERLKSQEMKQSAISSQATWKQAEGSTTRDSSLSLFIRHGNLSTSAGVFLASSFVRASTFFTHVVHPDMIRFVDKRKVLNAIIGFVAILVVNDFMGLKDSAQGFFHDEPVQSDVTFSIGAGMIWPSDHDVSIVGNNTPHMESVTNFNSILAPNLGNGGRSESEKLAYFGGSQPLSGKLSNFGNRNQTPFALNPESSHVVHNALFADTILFGDFQGRSQFGVIVHEYFLGKNHVDLSSALHEAPPEQKYYIPPFLISQEEHDMVWTSAKAKEGRIKSLSITCSEIKNQGDKVKIRTVPDITIRKYNKNSNLQIQRPESPNVELEIDQANYFNFVCDDIDAHQSDIPLMNKWSDDSSQQMAIYVDTEVLASAYASANTYNKGATAGKISGDINLGAAAAPLAVTKATILEAIVDCRTCLDEQNVPGSDRWLVIPAWMAGMIMKSDLKDASLTGDGTSPLRNGRLGMIAELTIYQSNLLATASDAGKTCFHSIAGHKSALSFAAQMTKMETLRSETTFGNIVRGLKVYGFKVLKDVSLVDFYVYKAA